MNPSPSPWSLSSQQPSLGLIKSIFPAHSPHMPTPFAQLEDVQMKLDLEIVPPRGEAGKAWSHPRPPTQLLRRQRQSILRLLAKWHGPDRCRRYPWLLAVLLYCCCILHPQAMLWDPPPLPRTLLCQALGWAPHTHRDVQTQPSSPRKIKV